MKRRHASLAVAFAMVAKVLGILTTSKTSVAVPSAPRQAANDYASAETCLLCHDAQGKHFQNTVMGKAFAHPKTDKEKLGCEACHGPGKAHVEAGGEIGRAHV